MKKPTDSEYIGISLGLYCANCIKPLKYNNHCSCLCLSCWLQFIADGCSDIQCEVLEPFDLV